MEAEGHDEEEGAHEQTWQTKSDHLLCVIDARRDMFEQQPGGGSTHFEAAMRVVLQTMKQKVILSDKDTVGIVWFGAHAAGSDAPEPVVEFAALDVPNAETIRKVQDLVRGDGFTSQYTSLPNRASEAGAGSLKKVLWRCQQTFMGRAIKDADAFKRVWIFTNDDSPLEGFEGGGTTADEGALVQQVARDAGQIGIEITVIPMARGRKFEMAFWRRLVCFDPDDDADGSMLGASSSSFDELLARVRRKQHKKRRLARMTLTVSSDGPSGETGDGIVSLNPSDETPAAFSFAVELFANVSIESKPTAVKLNQRSNQLVKSHTRMVNDATGEYLSEFDLRTYSDFGGSRAYISKQELAELKRCGTTSEPGLLLLGFKPLDALRPHHSIHSPYFIYPDEELVEGSTAAFAALHKAMLDKRMLALVRFTRSSGAVPRIAALVAQRGQRRDDGSGGLGEYVTPPGMHVVLMPFADEIRDAPGGGSVDHSAEQQDAAARLVRELKLPDAQCEFSSPLLQKHYAVLQAVALGEQELEWDAHTDDNLKPDSEGFQGSQIVESIQAFADSLPIAQAAAPKRKADTAAGGDSKRAASTADIPSDWREMVQDGRIHKETVGSLKNICTHLGLKVSGTKPVLISRLTEKAHE